MNEQTEAKGKKKEADSENTDPVHVIRRGAIAASVGKDHKEIFKA